MQRFDGLRKMNAAEFPAAATRANDADVDLSTSDCLSVAPSTIQLTVTVATYRYLTSAHVKRMCGVVDV